MQMFILIIVIIVALGLVYWFSLRKWLLSWGTIPQERSRVMAGDDIISNPTDIATQAITIAAPPANVWPWLVQIG